MGQALYRKYRSRGFDEVVGQDHIIQTLKSALKSGRISHAYLFTGPRGVGKTSVARIMAHAVNNLDYKDESAHLDIIEIDAASNRRIDEIRDLRERVRVAPAIAKYKVYIIDEVHMLTREAFNALLKTLEEPPAHAIFILATTEAHKLPETIVSRTQRFEFKPVSSPQAAKHLSDIAKKEKIQISPEALMLLAEFGNGSFRDSISYLDQLSSLGKKITEDDVRAILGLPKSRMIDELLKLQQEGDAAKLLKSVVEIEEQGVSPVAIAASLSNRLRTMLLQGNFASEQIELLKNLSQVSASSRPQEALEIVMLSSLSRIQPTMNRPGAKKIENGLKPPVNESKSEVKEIRTDFSLDNWDEVLDATKANAASLYTALRLAEPSYSDGKLTLKLKFPLHQKKLAKAGNKELIEKIIKQVCQANVIIIPIVRDNGNDQAGHTSPHKPISTINSIFGTAEVMEA